MRLPPIAHSARLVVLVVFVTAGSRGDAASQDEATWRRGFTSLAPLTVVADSLGRVGGIAADASGVLFTDRLEGTLNRIVERRVEVLATDLEGPTSVIADAPGGVLVLEQRAGRVLRIAADGVTSVVVGGLPSPSEMASGADGTLWVAGRQAGGTTLFRVDPSGELFAMARRFPDVRALAVAGDALLVATPSAVVRVSGSTGAMSPLLPQWRADALVVDRLGDVYLAGRPLGSGTPESRIVKYSHLTKAVTVFAERLRHVDALAMDDLGNLFAFEHLDLGRVIRFTAPGPPFVRLPQFTSRPALAVTGSAERGARVEALAANGVRVVATADVIGGQFSMELPVERSTTTALEFRAIGAAGRGLASAAVTAQVTHDDHLPRVSLSAPQAAVHVRGPFQARASAYDDGSGVGLVRFLIDDVVVGEVPGRGEQSVDAAVWISAEGAEGSHTITAAVEDRAGNVSAAAQMVVIDRTPPDTAVLEGPPAESADGSAVFLVGGSDAQASALDYSWRLDAAGWSVFDPKERITADRLAPGTHVFEVKARDLAGNEDPTPARWVFRVQALTLRIVEPTEGQTIGNETMWVRGDAGGTPPLVVSIALPPQFHQLAAAIQVPVVAGRFAVEVPVAEGQASIVITASDANGATVSETVELQVVAGLAPAVSVAAVPFAGFAPHAVQFGLNTQPEGSYTIDLESDGTAEYAGARPDGRSFVYASPGAFLATVNAVVDMGQPMRWRAPVVVYDRQALELELQGVWGGMKDALRGAAADAAAAFVHSDRRAGWRQEFAELLMAGPLDVDGTFTEIELVGFEGDRLDCEMMRAVDGLMFSFPVTFALDNDGRWRLWQF